MPLPRAAKVEAIPNFVIDIYHRTGLYPLLGLPAVIGMEGAGVETSLLAQKGSLFHTRPLLMDCIAATEDFQCTVKNLFDVARAGDVKKIRSINVTR